MKKRVLFLIFLILFLGLFVLSKSENLSYFSQKYFYVSKCNEPIYYKIGTIDPRFGLSRNQVISSSVVAAKIWNKNANLKLFEYDPKGELTINMVYDSRQALNTQIDQLKNDLDDGKTTLDEEEKRYENLSASFEERNKAFLNKVDEWNEKQNGTQEEFDKLLEEQQSLKNEAEKLNLIARQLNLSASQYNNKISNLNQTISTFNDALEERPEEGIYDPNNNLINIYFNNDQDELVRTIAHEMGHARGLGHLNDINSIMYPKTTNVLIPTKEEISMIEKICEDFPVYEPYIENFRNNMKIVLANLNL